ncbi:DUF460 domain-containing protein [Sulfolobus acidocaldarius]|uniref:Conserved Archaeal protein n=4 Tax=Sulfolobus acidocaldarius TaxID=2285 RepID=Q4JAL2_SULAC|nr:DUF460 domain-containing protein [Sulfolobus acidocaldarius]AAY80167.1 conserved Archaeal protein [Sulfolobus acidocaldarius DSM 639]AGE70745.1 hypothetical protein SacN8_03865 [Sulfolobus acidocaldarius N8]ALU28923.1 hypothetical protein ATY89_02420 [Sulfolobus acidocaldarius]ALU31649.1 hypothetical protein ATZ20_05455 [Sulfolobus acidocaldarius]WCM34716.1 DUF460 domain-containing protein [Sulfolobus acidocaldarius DSM 639]
MKIIGVDIEAGSSPLSSRLPLYAIVVLNDKGEIEYKQEGINIGKLLRLVWEIRPSKIALDNIYELAPNERKLIKIISMLPDNVELVQVTYIEGEFKDLREILRSLGIEVQGKLNPIKTAYYNALLAFKNVGTAISLRESKTKIIVSRGRAIGPGGMSSNRYKRNLRGLVLRATKKIKEELNKHGFDYDYVVKRSKMGIERAVFIVYAPRESLYGIVKKMRGHDLKVEIKPIYKNKIEFKDSKRLLKPVIVGVDPGIEVGISIIDIYSNPIYLDSKRNIDREEIIEIIKKYGKPVLIATDVNPASDTVKKISAQLRCRLFIPQNSLSIDEKTELVSRFSENHGIKINDPHVRDSLAAALKAYHEVSQKLRQAEGILRRMDLDIEEHEILECIIKGSTINECIENEIEKEIGKSDEEIKIVQDKNSNQTVPDTYAKAEELMEYKKEIERLKRKIRELVLQNTILQHKLDEIRVEFNAEVERDRKIYELKLEIQNMQKVIENLNLAIVNKQKIIENMTEIIDKVIKSEYIVLKKDNFPIYMRLLNKKIFLFDEQISDDMIKYVGDDYIIIPESLLKDLNILYRERLSQESSKIDLKKLIDNYRKSRLK